MPQNLFSEEEEEQEQFTRNYLTPKERERLERDLYDMGLLPHAYFTWAEEDKTAALRQLYDQGGINFYLEKLAADSQRDQLDGNLLNSVVKLLCDFSDTNENYWQKLQQGNILGSILNLMGATLRAPKTLVLNLSSMINSLLTWSEFTWQHDMTYREYLVQSGQKYGVRTLIDDLDKLRQTGALGKIAADTIETVFEMASDPLILIGMLNQFGVQTPGTQQYIEKLQRGGFVKQAAGVRSGPKEETDKILWDSWDNYEKVVTNGRVYAKVGNRLYSKHAVDRMQPSGKRFTVGDAIVQLGGASGRSVAPQWVEYIIHSVKPIYQPATGNYVYTLGTVSVITNEYGYVVTIMIVG